MRRPIAERSLLMAGTLLWGVIEVLALLRSRRADSRDERCVDCLRRVASADSWPSGPIMGCHRDRARHPFVTRQAYAAGLDKTGG